MIISHRHKFIFIKTMKTAGTSLEIALSQICGDDDILTPIVPETPQELEEMGYKGPQNCALPIRQYTVRHWRKRLKGKRPLLNSHIPARRIKQMLGRRVWDQYFKFSIERNPYDKAISLYYWSTRHADPRPSLDEYLDGRGRGKVSNWPIYSLDDEIAVDYMMRFESMTKSLAQIEQRLGLSTPLRMPKAKSGHRKNHQHYSHVLSPHAREQIEKLCSREIAAFGYTWDEQAPSTSIPTPPISGSNRSSRITERRWSGSQ